MNRRASLLLVALLAAAFPGATLGATPLPVAFGMAPAQFWRTAFGSGPWYPVAGDADGDGHADLLALNTADTTLAMARTSPKGKPLPENTARPGSGGGLIAAASGSFVRLAPAADVLMVFADGSMKLTSGMSPGESAYARTEPAGQIPAEFVPQAPTRSAVADFDGDGRRDVIVVDKNGTLLVLQNGGTGRFKPLPIRTKLPGGRQFVAGTLAGDKAGRLVWLDAAGTVFAALLDPKTGSLEIPRDLGKASPDDHLAVGRFRGGKAADVLVGQRLFVGGDPKAAVLLKDLPPLAVARDDGVWEVADVDGNGKDDLIRHHEGHERWGAQDVYVHFAYDSTEATKGYLSTANDGLPDLWKIGKVKPGGLDLAALGCKVGHRDVIVEIERFENADIADIRNNMNRAIRFFAEIPLANPDGTSGIALHVVYREPWAVKDHDLLMGHFDDHFPRIDRRGVVHAMFAEGNGPLVSAINGDRGHFNGHWQEFAHEFGHQLDLVHDGFYGSGSGWSSDTGSAIYPSLMSYTYSYGYDNQGDWVRYSDGKRAPFVLNPRHLSERLPYPFDAVRFLGAEPYHYRVSPTPDGKETLIDWDWNGVLGEKDVVANVKYTHGTDFGPSLNVATTTAAPVLVAHGPAARPRPLLVYVQGSALIARSWVGRNRDLDGDRWSELGADYASGIVGDPSAAYLGDGATWVAYRTAPGVVLRRLTLGDAGKPRFGPPTLLEGTVDAQPTVAALNGRLALLLWRGKGRGVELTMLRPKDEGLVLGAERLLDFRSDVPVGAVAGRVDPAGASLWVGRIAPDGEPNAGRTEVVRFMVDAGGGAKAASRLWVAGVYARHRMTLLWQEAGPKLPDGRITLLAGGALPGGPAGNDMYVSMNTPYPDYGEGWMLHRYRNPDFRARAAPAGCLFEGDVVVAFRYLDDRLDVGFYGTGATPWPTGDFDDVGHIRDYGLSRSIRNFAGG